MSVTEIMDMMKAEQKAAADFREHVEGMTNDFVDQATFKKLHEELTAKTKELAEANAKAVELAEKAAQQAGRRSAGGDDVPVIHTEHKTAFFDWLRNSKSAETIAALQSVQKKAVESGTPSQGGVAVPKLIGDRIQSKLVDESVLMGAVNKVMIGTADYSEVVDKGGVGYGWVGETDARPETATAELYDVDPASGTIYAYPKATEEALDDIFFDVENWLVDGAGTQFANGIDAAIVAGDGVKKPMGLLGRAPVADADGSRADQTLQFIAAGTGGTLDDADALISMVYSLKNQYRRNGSWFMNSASQGIVRTLKDGAGRYLWTDSIAPGQPATLLGYPVLSAEAMPDIAGGAHPIGFGDLMSGYLLVERHGLRVTRDEVTQPGYVCYHIRKRVEGDVSNDDAVRVLKINA